MAILQVRKLFSSPDVDYPQHNDTGVFGCDFRIVINVRHHDSHPISRCTKVCEVEIERIRCVPVFVKCDGKSEHLSDEERIAGLDTPTRVCIYSYELFLLSCIVVSIVEMVSWWGARREHL